MWTYASGFSDDRNKQIINCLCAATPGNSAHPFIREHYYCESGTTGDARLANIYFTGDPLWDGNGCISANAVLMLVYHGSIGSFLQHSMMILKPGCVLMKLLPMKGLQWTICAIN